MAKDKEVDREMSNPYESAPFLGAPGPWIDRLREGWEKAFVPRFEEHLAADEILKLVARWRHLEHKLCAPLLGPPTADAKTFVFSHEWLCVREDLILTTLRLGVEAVRQGLKSATYVALGKILESADPASKAPWVVSDKFEECDEWNRQLSLIAKAQGSNKSSDEHQTGSPPIANTAPPPPPEPPSWKDLVNAHDVARLLYRKVDTLDDYREEWPTPSIPHAGRRPAKWSYEELLPTLRRQFPEENLPDSLPSSLPEY